MDVGDRKRDVVDPEVRAHVSSLVTALGGSGADEDGRYVLGDDALACLRDLKKWLKLYDEKANRLDVARCIAESNLVGGDLLQILAAWPENDTEDKFKFKIALACLELLVPLTWPLDKDTQQMTVNHHRHIPYLLIAQLGYKRSIINFDGARILHTAVRCALPSMAEPVEDRSTRDEGIIKLLLYFIRNIAMIAPPPNFHFEGDEAEISRSATIDSFDYQDIFHLLLTISSTMGSEFNTQDVIVLDILFHLLKGVDVEKLFMEENQAEHSKIDELVRLRRKEAAMLRSYQTNAPTRHNRFGAMVWMHRDDAKKTTISGQTALTDSTRSLAKMDSTKKFKPLRRGFKGEDGPLDFDTPVLLNATASSHLQGFVEEFLDSGFNPLFEHIRKAMDREAERIMGYHPRQFFYLVSWFLKAERSRRKWRKDMKGTKAAVPERLDSFCVIAGVLNQEMFVTLNRAMESALGDKSWHDLSAAMKCFTQILLTVQDMSDSRLEEDQDIAENILSRIFYEESTHDRVATITRTYKDQGFGYLDSLTDLAHNYLRILEQYSKQNTDLQVRSRKRVRRKKKAAITNNDTEPNNDSNGSDAEDEASAERTSLERKFDFKRFCARFLTQGCVDTFVAFTTYYNDLKPAQLKRSHRFFYRVAFKQEMSVMLFRVDIIALLNKMIKGPEGLDPQCSVFKEWDELVRQIFKKCIRKIQERPELVVEMLFSKINSTAHYLEYGYEKQTVASKPRAAAELQVKGERKWEEQVSIVVSALLDKDEGDHLQWIKFQLSLAENERRSWEGANKALLSIEKDPPAEIKPTPPAETEKYQAPSIFIKADNNTRKIAMFKNGLLRLLMSLVGFEYLGNVDNPEISWIVPSSVRADTLQKSLEIVKKSELSPVYDDGVAAADLVTRKSRTASRKKPISDDEVTEDERDLFFEPGDPTSMKRVDAIETLKKRRRSRNMEESEDADDRRLTDEQLEARNAARRARELEKNRKIKSDLFVHASDEETDEERDRIFYEQEEKIRQRSKIAVMKELLAAGEGKLKSKSSGNKGNLIARTGDPEDEDGDNDDDIPVAGRKKRQSNATAVDSDVESERGRSSSVIADKDNILIVSEEENTDTPISSPYTRPSEAKRRKVTTSDDQVLTKAVGMSSTAINSHENEDVLIFRAPRQRVKAGFIVESSDEE